MDTQDRLDQLLERSAPATVHVSDDLTRALDQATYSARAQVTAEQPRVRRMPRVVAGVGLAVLLTAGAGTAVAAGGFERGAVGPGSRCCLRLHLAERS